MKTIKAIIARTIWQNVAGVFLINSKSTLLIKTRFGIHTFFVNRALDIALLDDQNRVVVLKEELKPFSIYFFNPKYSLVLEMPSGTIAKRQLQLGDTIKII